MHARTFETNRAALLKKSPSKLGRIIAFYRMEQSALPEFIAAVAGLTSEADYRKLADRFAVRRTSRDFWRHSDGVHEAYRRIDPVEAGLLDYNRLENR